MKNNVLIDIDSILIIKDNELQLNIDPNIKDLITILCHIYSIYFFSNKSESLKDKIRTLIHNSFPQNFSYEEILLSNNNISYNQLLENSNIDLNNIALILLSDDNYLKQFAIKYNIPILNYL